MNKLAHSVRIAAIVLVLASAAAGARALQKPDPSLTPADLFVVDGRACYLAELGSVGTFRYELFYTVYFDCKALPTEPPKPPPPPEVPLLEQIRDQLIKSFQQQFGDVDEDLDEDGGEELTLNDDAFDLDSDSAGGATSDSVADTEEQSTLDSSASESDQTAEGDDPAATSADAGQGAFVALIHDEQGPEGPELHEYEVSAISDLDEALIDEIKVLGCVGEVCRPLALACLDDGEDRVGGTCGERVKLVQEFDSDGNPTFESALWFQIDRGEGLQKGEDIRIFVPTGLVKVRRSGTGAAEESPDLVAVLPRLGQSDKSVLASQPLFKFSLSPLTDDQQNLANEGGGDSASVFFAGGLRRLRAKSAMGWTYSGNLATAEEVSFSAIRTDLEYSKNLSKTFLPLTLSAGAESNQGFDIVNATARATVDFILPFNINYSPTDSGYIPNTGPVLRLIGELGTKIDESSEMKMAGVMPDNFERAGYDLTWTIPVARDTIIDFHAAGLWVFSSDMPDDFHDLWEFTVKTKIGGLDYFLGYQRGEAAPLFKPVETTQAGLLIKFGDKFRCEQQPGSDSKFHCAEP